MIKCVKFVNGFSKDYDDILIEETRAILSNVCHRVERINIVISTFEIMSIAICIMQEVLRITGTINLFM